MNRQVNAHDQIPLHPADGDTFTCSACGAAFEYVGSLNGNEGEWVSL